MLKYPFYLLVCIVIVGCSDETTSTNQAFLLKPYLLKFEKELSKHQIVKFISTNQEKDTLILTQPDFRKELNLFFENDIEVSKIAQNYQVTTNKCSSNYTAKNAKNSIQSIDIQTCNDTTIQIIISKKTDLYDQWYRLEINKTGYLIISKQDLAMGAPTSYRIEGKAHNGNTK